jgi:hypothetical protein
MSDVYAREIEDDMKDAVQPVYEELRKEMVRMPMPAERLDCMNAQARSLKEALQRVPGVAHVGILSSVLAYLRSAEMKYVGTCVHRQRQRLITESMATFQRMCAARAVPATAEECSAALKAAQLEADIKVAVSVQSEVYRVIVVCTAMRMCGPM